MADLGIGDRSPESPSSVLTTRQDIFNGVCVLSRTTKCYFVSTLSNGLITKRLQVKTMTADPWRKLMKSPGLMSECRLTSFSHSYTLLW